MKQLTCKKQGKGYISLNTCAKIYFKQHKKFENKDETFSCVELMRRKRRLIVLILNYPEYKKLIFY